MGGVGGHTVAERGCFRSVNAGHFAGRADFHPLDIFLACFSGNQRCLGIWENRYHFWDGQLNLSCRSEKSRRVLQAARRRSQIVLCRGECFMPLRGIVELCFRRVGDGFWEFLLWGPLNARAEPCMLGHPYLHSAPAAPGAGTKQRAHECLKVSSYGKV